MEIEEEPKTLKSASQAMLAHLGGADAQFAPAEEVMEGDVAVSADVITPVERPAAGGQEETAGYSVPYARFSKVVAKKNAMIAENEQLKHQLAALQQRHETAAAPKPDAPSVPSWLDNYFQEDAGGEDVAQEKPDRFSAIEKRLHEMEVERHTVSLLQELEKVKQKYPDINVASITAAYAGGLGETLSLEEIADGLEEYNAAVADKAVQSYLQRGAGSRPVRESPPGWPKGARGTASSASTQDTFSPPKNFAEAMNALLKHLNAK